MDTLVNLHIFPLGYYDILIGMDWLESHNAIIDCLHKSLGFRDEEGKYYTVKGIYRPISTRQILAVQIKKCIRKGCQLYAIKIKEMGPKNSTSVLEQFPILKEFQDVFPDEMPRLPPKRDLDFTIDLIPGSTPVS